MLHRCKCFHSPNNVHQLTRLILCDHLGIFHNHRDYRPLIYSKYDDPSHIILRCFVVTRGFIMTKCCDEIVTVGVTLRRAVIARWFNHIAIARQTPVTPKKAPASKGRPSTPARSSTPKPPLPPKSADTSKPPELPPKKAKTPSTPKTTPKTAAPSKTPSTPKSAPKAAATTRKPSTPKAAPKTPTASKTTVPKTTVSKTPVSKTTAAPKTPVPKASLAKPVPRSPVQVCAKHDAPWLTFSLYKIRKKNAFPYHLLTRIAWFTET